MNLNEIKLFDGIEKKDKEKLIDKFKIEKIFYKKGEVIFFRNDDLDGMTIIISGKAGAEMLKESGEVKKIEDLFAGDIIASAFIFGDQNFIPVDLVAITDVEVLHINKKNLINLFSDNKKILENFLNDISNKTQFLSKKIWKSFNTKTIKEKIDDYILENSVGEYVEFKHSIKELSEIFEVTRPSLSRVIGEYIEKNRLEKIGRNKYKILDKEIFNK
nr:Crp/Fnr family transcriptional regulator [uncultured Cetobacterium sp.]